MDELAKEKLLKEFDLFGEMITQLDLLKKRCYQAIFLGHERELPAIVDVPEGTATMAGLMGIIKEEIDKVEALIPEEIVGVLDEEDYEVYTRPLFGRIYWNEMDLPELVDYYTGEMAVILKINNPENNTHMLTVYDLSDYDFYFKDYETLEAIVEVEDVAPATIYEMTITSNGTELEEIACF